MKQALRDLIRLPRCIGLITHGNNARRHLGLGIWRTRSLIDQQAAGYAPTGNPPFPDFQAHFPPTWARHRLCAAASMRTILEREAEARSKEPARRRALGQE